MDVIHTSIEDYVSSEFEYEQAYDEHRLKEDRHYEWSYKADGNEDWSSDERGTYVAEMAGQAPEYPDPLNWAIAGLFHPAVGAANRIQELRGAVMRDLSYRPKEVRDKLWHEIAGTVETFEGDLHANADAAAMISFDFDTACKQFGYLQ